MTAPEGYSIPASKTRVEDEAKGSRFVTTVAHAPSADAATELIDAVRAEFPDATHHCWAYVIGPPGSSRAVGASDDNEPAGTAGRPMLTVLLNSGVGDVVAVVTRYFGGVKLGRGGLVRAYGGAVKHALRETPLSRHVERVRVRVTMAYAAVDSVLRHLPQLDAAVKEEIWGDDATLVLSLPRSGVDDLRALVLEVTGGAGRLDTL